MCSAGAGAGVGAAAGGAPAHAARAKQSATATHRIGAQATTRPFDPSICPIDWRAIPYDDLPILRTRQRRRSAILHGLREAAALEIGGADTHPSRRADQSSTSNRRAAVLRQTGDQHPTLAA